MKQSDVDKDEELLGRVVAGEIPRETPEVQALLARRPDCAALLKEFDMVTAMTASPAEKATAPPLAQNHAIVDSAMEGKTDADKALVAELLRDPAFLEAEDEWGTSLLPQGRIMRIGGIALLMVMAVSIVGWVMPTDRGNSKGTEGSDGSTSNASLPAPRSPGRTSGPTGGSSPGAQSPSAYPLQDMRPSGQVANFGTFAWIGAPPAGGHFHLRVTNMHTGATLVDREILGNACLPQGSELDALEAATSIRWVVEAFTASGDSAGRAEQYANR